MFSRLQLRLIPGKTYVINYRQSSMPLLCEISIAPPCKRISYAIAYTQYIEVKILVFIRFCRLDPRTKVNEKNMIKKYYGQLYSMVEIGRASLGKECQY